MRHEVMGPKVGKPGDPDILALTFGGFNQLFDLSSGLPNPERQQEGLLDWPPRPGHRRRIRMDGWESPELQVSGRKIRGSGMKRKLPARAVE